MAIGKKCSTCEKAARSRRSRKVGLRHTRTKSSKSLIRKTRSVRARR